MSCTHLHACQPAGPSEEGDTSKSRTRAEAARWATALKRAGQSRRPSPAPPPHTHTVSLPCDCPPPPSGLCEDWGGMEPLHRKMRAGEVDVFFSNKVHRGPGTNLGEQCVCAVCGHSPCIAARLGDERLVLFLSWVPLDSPKVLHCPIPSPPRLLTLHSPLLTACC